MAAKKFNICRETGLPVTDRVYNRSAQYTKVGLLEMRKRYQRDYHKRYFVLKKVVGLGLLSSNGGIVKNA